ncbi:hypothetical protein ACFC1R_06345 [Kitasatospora sp. NPDC056138]|uniref:hypothetical protein n=1 Tax=Kitasatospora sp. NPDC056138 TaxID=3345724 RepID=UPI0035DB60E9
MARKAVAGLAWAAVAGMYTWGLLHLFFLDDQGRAQACAAAVGTGHLTGYVPSFMPLHFGCRTGDGRTVEAVIPSYLNPVLALLVVCAAVLTGFAIAHRKGGTG